MPLGRAVEYGYLSARCHSIRSSLMSYETLKDLATSRSIGELYNALEATPYAPFIKTVSAEGIHGGLSAAFAYQRKRIITEIKKANREIFKLFFEVKYALVDEKILQAHEKNPEENFSVIDKNYIVSLKKSMLKLSAVEQRNIKKILGSYFDLLNLYNLVKFRVLYRLTIEETLSYFDLLNLYNLVKFRVLYRLTIEETLSYMFPYAEHFNIKELTLLCDIENIGQLSNRIEPILGNSFDSYESFRRVLYRYHQKKLLSIWNGYPFTISIPFSLLRLIEIEISDIRAITEGVEFELGSSEISAMIVGG